MEKKMDIHISLPNEVLERLNQIAREHRVTRALLVREAVTEYLNRKEAERIQREMTRYVEALADDSGDFVAETEAHTVRRLLRDTKW